MKKNSITFILLAFCARITITGWTIHELWFTSTSATVWDIWAFLRVGFFAAWIISLLDYTYFKNLIAENSKN